MSRRASRSRRSIAALLLVLLVGCHTWQPATVSPRSVVTEEHPPSVRLTLADGRTLTLKNPMVRNDSIVSIVTTAANQPRQFGQPGPSEVIGAAVGDIDVMEVHRFSRSKTIGFVVVAVAIAAGWAGVATRASGGKEPTDVDPGKAVR